MDHVTLDRLDETNSCVVPLGDDVDEPILDIELDVYAGMACAKLDQHRIQEVGECHARHAQPQCPHRLAWSGWTRQCLAHLRDRRRRALNEPPPLIRKAYAASRAGQQRDAQMGFELSDRLAHRGAGYTELARSAAEVLEASDKEERLELWKRSAHPLEDMSVTTLDCPAWIYSLSSASLLLATMGATHTLHTTHLKAMSPRHGVVPVNTTHARGERYEQGQVP